MHTNRLLSIIIPVYNTELYLAECLDSIICQNLESYEILIINDGSVDRSKDIIMKYCEIHDNIIYFEQENSGQGTARNVGISHSTGKYLYFMDSDDYLAAKKFKQIFDFVLNEDLDAVFFDGQSFLHENPNQKIKGFDYIRSQEYGYFSSGEDLFSRLSKKNELLISPCLYIVKSDVVKANHLLFPDNIKHEDEYFTVNLFLYIKNCYHSKEVVFLRRLRENSTMTNNNKAPSLNGYTKVLQFFDYTYNSHHFQTDMGKKAYYKKINQLVKAAFRSYSQIRDKKQEQVRNNSRILKEIVKKYDYFNTSTRIYILLSKNKLTLKIYTKAVEFMKKR